MKKRIQFDWVRRIASSFVLGTLVLTLALGSAGVALAANPAPVAGFLRHAA